MSHVGRGRPPGLQPRRLPTRISAHPAMPVLLAIVVALAGWLPLSAVGPASAAMSTTETPPIYFHGSAAVPRGLAGTDIANRFITSSSMVFLTDDTTSWPAGDVSIKGIRVNNRGTGFFTASTLDQSLAPTSGVPFNYLVVNASSGTIDGLPFLAGRATIPAGVHNTGVNLAGVTASSVIILTVDASSISTSVVLPGLKINNKGSGFFTVTTLGLENAPSTGIPFNYLVINGSSGLYAATGRIGAGVANVGVSTQSANSPAGVFLTVDAATIAGADVSLPGVKVNNHGAGFFTVTTTGLTAAPNTGVPFDWLVVEPPARWEELGPTGTSGNVWTIQVDPANRDVVYVGSSWGGVWKTTNGGQTWFPAWNQGLIGIYRLAMQPGEHNTLYAMDVNGYISVTHDGGSTWTLLSAQPDVVDPRLGPMMQALSNGGLYVCTAVGLQSYAPGTLTPWQHIEPTSDRSCTDVQVAADGTLYAAFRQSGVYRRIPGQAWTQIKATFLGDTVRIALGPGRIVVNDDQVIFTNSIPNLGEWHFVDHDFCGTGDFEEASQYGYDLSVAISPTNADHFLAFGHCGRMTTDGGATVFPDGETNTNYLCPDSSGHLAPCFNLNVGQDDHQVVFWDDQHVYMATDNGPRFSNNGGRDWGETTAGPSRITWGPPVTEFRNLNISGVDQFGRVFLAGNVQDHGATAIAGRATGFRCCGGEAGVTVAATHPSNSSDSRFTTYRYYGTDEVAGGNKLFLCTVGVPGPDYLAPATAEFESDYPIPNEKPCPNVGVRQPDGTITFAFAADVTSIATAPDRIDFALVGLANGDVYRTTVFGNGTSFERIPSLAAPEGANVAITSFIQPTPSTAYVGYNDGAIYKLTNPYGTAADPSAQPIVRKLPGLPAQRVIAITSDGKAPGELYAAVSKSIWKSRDDGFSWTNVTGSGALASNLAGEFVFAMAIDLDHPYLYVATGPGGRGTVFRSTRPATGSWDVFDDGLPAGIPITGLVVAPNRGLYLSSNGRGVWWRRDIAAVPPNSGVNTPADGQSHPGEWFTITTTCSDPQGWHHIATFAFALAMGNGAEDGNPAAMGLEYDENRNVVRLFDPDRGVWQEGAPGSSAVLHNRYVLIRLDQTTVVGVGSEVPKQTVQIAWRIELNANAGSALQQWLRVTDDGGNSTTWDRVGSWTVSR